MDRNLDYAYANHKFRSHIMPSVKKQLEEILRNPGKAPKKGAAVATVDISILQSALDCILEWEDAVKKAQNALNIRDKIEKKSKL